MTLLIGIDLGGTKTEIVVLNESLKILHRERFMTDSTGGQKKLINDIYLNYIKIIQKFDNSNHKLGIGLPGRVSSATKKLNNSTIQCLNGMPIKKLFEDKFELTIKFENDANCFALAEAILGAGKKYSSVYGLIMGTGCGGGLVIDKKIYKGQNNNASEIGHTVLSNKSEKCFCGKNGCVNMFISGTALENKILERCKTRINAKNFLTQDEFSNTEKKILKEFFEIYGIVLSNIIYNIDPSVIILGGGLSNFSNLYSEGLKYVAKNYKLSESLCTPIKKNMLGDSAGVIGAALIARSD